ncbi:MAG: hypothetical protein AAFY41_15340, partial [Bacteroidota bacterium]
MLRPVSFLLFGLIFFSSYGQVEKIDFEYEGISPITVRIYFDKIIDTDCSIRLKGSSKNIFGKWMIKDGYSEFKPDFPFDPGLTYTLISDDKALMSFSPERKSKIPTEVVSVYPSSDELPENILKMYIIFSGPMSDGSSYKNIEFKTDEEIVQPYLDLKPELWSKDRKRMTLWFDPGRIKQHIARNERLGAPLVLNKTYKISLANEWEDKDSQPLKTDYFKTFHTVDPYRSRLNPKLWKIGAPKSASQENLSIHFDRIMDYLLLAETISINRNSEEVEGNSTITNNEKTWLFKP